MSKIIGQPQLLKKVNATEIERIIREKGPISKPALSKVTGLSLPTVNKVVSALEVDEKVKAVGLMGKGAGRRANVYVANQKAGHYLIIYYQSGDFICSITDLAGEENCNYRREHTPKKNSALKTLFAIIDDMLAHCENEVKAIGIGVPGVVKMSNVLTNIPSIPELDGANLKQILEDKYEIPTYIENDIKLTAVGYYHNHYKKKFSDMIYLYVGSGLGSGIIINKKLHKGPTSFAGEFGYMLMNTSKFKETDELKLNLEERILELESRKKVTLSDEERRIIEDEICRLVTTAVINIVCILNPEVVVLGGESINEQIAHEIGNKILDYISYDNLPQVIYDPDCLSGIDGTKNMCISHVSSGLKVIKENGV